MAELFQALDQWLKSGGFLPRDWDKGRVHTHEMAAMGRAVAGALAMLEQIARRSSDASSRALAEGARADLAAVMPEAWKQR